MAERKGRPRTRASTRKVPPPMYSEAWNASHKGLRGWKQILKSAHKGEKLVYGLLFPTDVDRPRMVQLPVFTEPNDTISASGWVADVNMTHWFPRGKTCTRVNKLPSAAPLLKNGYTIVTSKCPERSPLNRCVGERFGQVVRGNVLVLRHRYRLPELVTNLHSYEHQFVEILVEQVLADLASGASTK